MANLEVALSYLDRGWSVFPLSGKLAAVPWKAYQSTRPTREQVEAWWTVSPDSGIGVALGSVSNLVRIDADGSEAIEQLAKLGGMPTTAEFSTPAGGRGWLLVYMEGMKTEVLWRGSGAHQELRIQSDGAYTVLPPSSHPNGGQYQWVNEERPAKCPRWMYDRYVERALKDLVRELRPTARQPDREELVTALSYISSEDYDTWIQVGMALKSAGDEYLEVWEKWSQGSAKFHNGECANKWNTFNSIGGVTTRSILFWAEREGYNSGNRHEPLTDLGNARVLARMGEGKILHSAKWGWLHWDGRRWNMEDAEKQVQELQKQALEYRLNQAVESLAKHLKSNQEADDYKPKGRRKSKTIASIRRMEDEGRIRGSRILAQSEPALSADYRRFDRLLFAFNCANGTLDLETETLRPHEPSDMLTQLSAVAYDPDATCPRWEQFLEEILPDASVRAFIQRFLGACLTGDVTLQIMPVLWGDGANGKSTFVTTIMEVLGEDYAMKAKRDMLMAKRHSEHPTSIARLRGKRFVACVESAEDGKLDETMVKELTGSDVIAARRMREDEWEFIPTHKLVLVTNHKPEVKGTDNAIWRRLPLVPFQARFLDGDPRRDPDLQSKLRAELPGILRWMVAGCTMWLSSGKVLEKPGVVTEATAEYRKEQDRLGSFFEEKCVLGEDKRGRSENIVTAYLQWCTVNRYTPLSANAFGRALTERGFPLEAKGSKYRKGIDLC